MGGIGIMYAIYWKCKITGMLGNGQPVYDKKTAQNEADRLNKDVPNIFHWIEEQDKERGVDSTGHSYGFEPIGDGLKVFTYRKQEE